MLVDLRVVQLLCSRLCHDLVGPAGAINAGLELMGDAATDPDEALALVDRSAQQVASRLAFYRMAFGQAGNAGATAPLADARKLAEGFLAGGGVALDWPDDAGYDAAKPIPSAAVKLVLNMMLLGIESLPRGGVLTIRFADLADGVGVAMTACGENAALRDDVRQALDLAVPAAELSVRTVQGHFAAWLARKMAAEIEITEGSDDAVRLAVVLPAVAG